MGILKLFSNYKRIKYKDTPYSVRKKLYRIGKKQQRQISYKDKIGFHIPKTVIKTKVGDIKYKMILSSGFIGGQGGGYSGHVEIYKK